MLRQAVVDNGHVRTRSDGASHRPRMSEEVPACRLEYVAFQLFRSAF
jgi:hypothetical protein